MSFPTAPIDDAALLLTAEQTCRVLNVSRPTLYRLLGDGALRSLRIRGRRMFRRNDIERFVARAANATREAHMAV